MSQDELLILDHTTSLKQCVIEYIRKKIKQMKDLKSEKINRKRLDRSQFKDLHTDIRVRMSMFLKNVFSELEFIVST